MAPKGHKLKLLRQIRAAGGLCVERLDGEARYFLPNGRTVRADAVERYRSNGWLIPQGDGLLPGMTQTFKVPEWIV